MSYRRESSATSTEAKVVVLGSQGTIRWVTCMPLIIIMRTCTESETIHTALYRIARTFVGCIITRVYIQRTYRLFNSNIMLRPHVDLMLVHVHEKACHIFFVDKSIIKSHGKFVMMV